jgi:LysM repeat protein
LALILVSPLFAHAKILSIVQGLLASGEDQGVENNSPNSQKMALLRAAVSLNPSIGGGGITIVSGNALLSESVGPSSGEGTGLLRGSDQISVYVVREGDSLSQIAQMFDVSVNTIRWGNNIKGSNITPGQTLVILPISGVEHIVKSGDTLAKIAKRYKGDLDEVLAYNDLSLDSDLSIGDKIIIPDGLVGEPTSSGSRLSGGSSSQIVSTDGYYLRPVSGRRSQGIHGYNGIDIAAPYGTPVVASAAGVVTVSRGAGWNGGYGSYIVISHPNGTQTLYAHNSQNIVSPGQQVSQGQVIGYIGATGRATGPHVHFEVRGARNPF